MPGCTFESATSLAGEISEFDRALRMMAEIAPLSNHGPMAAEALVELGHGSRVIEFAKVYNRYYYSSYPSPKSAVTDENWKQALSDKTRLADWVAYFRGSLEEGNWQKLVGDWVPRLAPGLSAAAAHGVIRTGHAIRSLERADTADRRYELGQALGYWAAYYHEIPESDEISKQMPASDAVKQVPMIEPEKVSHTRSIMRKLEVVSKWKPFEKVSGMFDASRDPAESIADITEAFAGLFVRHGNRGNTVSMVHSVTGTAMLRSLLPYLTEAEQRRLIRYGWQMAAGIYSASGNETRNEQRSAAEIRIDDLKNRAALSNEVHAIKFTEACLREHEVNSNSIYLIAAEDAIARLGTVG